MSGRIFSAGACILVMGTFALAAEKNAKQGPIRQALVKQYDANGNGKLDPEEEAVVLKKYDTNGDGQLDRSEKVAMFKAVAGKRKPVAVAGSDGEISKWSTPGLTQANSMGGGKATIPDAGKFRVFVLMGQSNMHGTAPARDLKAPYTEKHERIRVWANGRWEYLLPASKFGPGVSMAHQLAEHWPDDTIGIIKVSVGGTGIRAFEKNWSEERVKPTFDQAKGSMYRDLMNAVEEAKKVSKPVFSGFVWKQGGADGTRKDLAEEYFGTFKQLVADLRKDLAAPELPVFVLTNADDEALAKAEAEGIENRRKYIITVLRAHNRAGREISNATAVHHGKLPKMPDGIHYDAEGQITLGKMTADAVEKFYSK